MHDHGWLFTCAVLLVFPASVAAQDASSAADTEETDRRLRKLEAKYEETGEPKYLFERVLTLEKAGEYEFALEIIEKHREEFEADPDIDGVSVVEQRLRRRLSGDESDDADESSERGERPGFLDWTLTGSGAGSLAGGLTAILVAEHRANRLRCSPASTGSNSADCGGVQPFTGLTRSEFDRKRRGVRTLRAVGIGLGAVGTGLATWGVVRLLSDDRSRRAGDRSASAVRPTVVWTPEALELGLAWRF